MCASGWVVQADSAGDPKPLKPAPFSARLAAYAVLWLLADLLEVRARQDVPLYLKKRAVERVEDRDGAL